MGPVIVRFLISALLVYVLPGASAQSNNPPRIVDVLLGQVDKGNKIDAGLLEKVRRLYPDVSMDRRTAAARGPGMPFFSLVQEVARTPLSNGREGLVVQVRWIIPAALVDHGRGELLFFTDAHDEIPLVRKSTFALTPIRRVGQRWLQFGSGNILLPFAEKEALLHFERQGDGALSLGLAREASRSALEVYRREGRDAFLKIVPVRGEFREAPRLPDKISGFEIYPSLVEDSRYSFFKYFDSWEATLFARLTPADPTGKQVVVEIGSRGLTSGIDTPDVKLFVWNSSEKEPTDRPEPNTGAGAGVTARRSDDPDPKDD